MKKRVLSLFMALALCLTLLPTAALAEETEGTAQTPLAVEESADQANGEAKQEDQPAAPEQENQSAEQEEQQEDSTVKQDGAVATVQAMIDALPDELDGMDDEEAMAVYEAFQAACGAYYDTLTEEQQAQLKNTEKLAALSDWFSQPAALAEGTAHTNHPICGETCTDGKHTGDSNILSWTGISKLDEIAGDGNYYLTGDVAPTGPWTCNYNVALCLNGYSIKAEYSSTSVTVAKGKTFTLTDCNGSKSFKKFSKNDNGRWVQDDNGPLTVNGGAVFHQSSKGGTGVDVSNTGTFTMYGGTICGNSGGYYGGGVSVNGTFHMSAAPSAATSDTPAAVWVSTARST